MLACWRARHSGAPPWDLGPAVLCWDSHHGCLVFSLLLHPFLVRGKAEGLPIAAQALPAALERGWSCLQQVFAQATMLWLTPIRVHALDCSGLPLPHLLSLPEGLACGFLLLGSHLWSLTLSQRKDHSSAVFRSTAVAGCLPFIYWRVIKYTSLTTTTMVK